MSRLPDLDPVLHQRARLGICGMLVPATAVEFRLLRDELGLTDSNLSQHLTVLEEAGYVEIEKRAERRHPRTWVKLTPIGRKALKEYVAALNRLVGPGAGPS